MLPLDDAGLAADRSLSRKIWHKSGRFFYDGNLRVGGSFGIEEENLLGFPVARRAAPAFGIPGLGRLMETMSFGYQGSVFAALALCRGNEFERAMATIEDETITDDQEAILIEEVATIREIKKIADRFCFDESICFQTRKGYIEAAEMATDMIREITQITD